VVERGWAAVTKLTDEQKRFLTSQQILERAVFDAAGMPPRFYRPLMEREEKLFVIGVSPCLQRGHTMRTRAGHCVQCDTKKIAFITRYFQRAYVYIAGSRRTKLVKLGSSRTPWNREAIINQLGYGGISDWRLLYYAQFANAGKVEFTAHRTLAGYSTPRFYTREYAEVECREIFRCNYEKALESASPEGLLEGWEHPDTADFNFSY
jgi:hypothetical protein